MSGAGYARGSARTWVVCAASPPPHSSTCLISFAYSTGRGQPTTPEASIQKTPPARRREIVDNGGNLHSRARKPCPSKSTLPCTCASAPIGRPPAGGAARRRRAPWLGDRRDLQRCGDQRRKGSRSAPRARCHAQGCEPPQVRCGDGLGQRAKVRTVAKARYASFIC